MIRPRLQFRRQAARNFSSKRTTRSADCFATAAKKPSRNAATKSNASGALIFALKAIRLGGRGASHSQPLALFPMLKSPRRAADFSCASDLTLADCETIQARPTHHRRPRPQGTHPRAMGSLQRLPRVFGANREQGENRVLRQTSAHGFWSRNL